MTHVVAGLLIDAAGRALVQQRTKGKFQGKWEIPGGKVHEGETHAEALAREFAEELGIAPRVGRRLSKLDRVEGEGDAEHRLFFYRVFSLEHPVSAEGQPIRWVGLRGVDSYDFLPQDRAVLLTVLE